MVKRKNIAAGTSNGEKRNKGKQPTSTNPFNIIFNEKINQDERYNILVTRNILSTKFMNDFTLVALGIKNQVFDLFTQVGWEIFVTMRRPIYKHLVIEFLSSLVVRAEAHVKGGNINFRIFNKDYIMTIAEFGRILGFAESTLRAPKDKFVANTFWKQISWKSDGLDNTFDSRKSKASLIFNPVLRYAQKLLAHTIFGREDSVGVCREVELFVLHSMIHGVKLDGGFFLAKQLEKVSKAKSGGIVMGGIITMIVEKLNVDFSTLAIDKPISYIDFGALEKSGMIRQIEDGWLYMFGGQRMYTLPNKERTDVKKRETWLPVQNIEQQTPDTPFATQSPSSRPYRSLSPQPSRGPPPPGFSLLQELNQRLINVEKNQEQLGTQFQAFQNSMVQMQQMIQHMYQWQVSQQGTQPPPPPPAPSSSQ